MFLEYLEISMALCCIWAWLIPHFYIEYMEYHLALVQSRRREIPTSTSSKKNASTGMTNNNGDEQQQQQQQPPQNHNNNYPDCTIPWNGKQIKNLNDNDDDDDDDDDTSQDNRYNNKGRGSSLDDDDDDNNNDVDESTNKALLRGAAAALLILLVVYTGSAIGIAIPTANMDRRADAIVVGFGRILSAFLFAVFSVEIPQWLGVTYSSSQRGNYYKQQQVSPTTTTTTTTTTHKKELSFRVCWSILGHFFVMYGIMLLHFSNPTRWSIPISTAVGIVFGFGVIWAVYVGRTTYKNHTTLIAFVFSFVIMVSSAAAFSAGCWYIKEMWYEEDIGYQDEYTLITFFGWLSLCVIANALYYRVTKRKLKAAIPDSSSTIGASSSAMEGDLIDDVKSTWRYKSQVFQPPDSVCFAATELSKATARIAVDTVRSPFKRAGSTLSRLRTKSTGSSSRHSTTTHHQESTAGEDNGGSSSYVFPRRRAVSADVGTTEKLPQGPSNRARVNTEPFAVTSSLVNSPTKKRDRTYSELSCSSSAFCTEEEPPQQQQQQYNPTELILASLDRLPLAGSEADFCSSLFDPPLDSTKTGSVLSFEDGMESRHTSFFEPPEIQSSDCRGLPNRPCLDVEEPIAEEGDDNNDDKSIINEVEPSLWFMIKTNTCCGKRRHYKAPPRKRWELILNVIKWTLWGITSAMHIVFLIICIGATAQQERVRAALPGTFSLLYPSDYVESFMCAWNQSSPNADIRTFDSLDAVLEANYTVIHCGACGSCSNWNDLSLQWTTRSNLAALGQECVKEKLYGGTKEDVQQCNEDLIGFTEECSTCWTNDQLCAKKNCVFIYLQSLLVNQVGNFNVDPDDITATSCDEALCGPEFVPCSGATRRRMNIVSDIPRPRNQQCTVANEDWASIFDHP